MNDRTTFHHIRRDFQPGFGELVGADMVKEANRLRAEEPGLPASAVLVRWRGKEPVSMTRVIHHPPGVEAPIALVAGRHTRCDLKSIHGASLRHALLLFWPPTGETELPFAEVIDLGTRTGISLLDGRLAARLASCDPIRFGVASADVVILHALAGEPFPVEPAVLSRLLGKLPDRAEVTLHGNWPHTLHLDVSGTADPDGGRAHAANESCVVIRADRSEAYTFGSENAMLTQVFSLGEGHLNAGIQVRAKDLERGVRLGRYKRCRGSSALRLDERISRVHAHVLDRGGRRWLFDTASTNGTKVVAVDTGETTGPVRGERTFTLLEGQAPSLAGKVVILNVGLPVASS